MTLPPAAADSTLLPDELPKRASNNIPIKIALPDAEFRMLGWQAHSYCLSRAMSLNQMIAWAYYFGRADTAVVKLLRRTSGGSAPAELRPFDYSCPEASANRIGAIYQRALQHTRDNPGFPKFSEKKLAEHYGGLWTPHALVVLACFKRFQSMFSDLSRWQPDEADGLAIRLPGSNGRHGPQVLPDSEAEVE